MTTLPPRPVPEPLPLWWTDSPGPVAPPPVAAPKLPPVHWRPVAVAGGLALLLVGGLIAWLATQRPRQDGETTPPPVEAPAVTVRPAPRPPAALPVTPPRAVAPAVVTVAPAASPPPAAVTVVARAEPSPPVEEEFEPPPPAKEEKAAPSAADRRGETYGTSVLFLSNPAEAARAAKKEEKLLFVLHVSGNFEESCFT